MNYKEIYEKREKLRKEINGLKVIKSKNNYNEIIKQKKAKYNFYNQLLKNM